MALGKQSKTLSSKQIDAISTYLRNGRNGIRNNAIFLLSAKAGLRAKEIANLRWSMVVDSDGRLTHTISLTDSAAKGSSGRTIPMNKTVYTALDELLHIEQPIDGFTIQASYVVRSERSDRTSPQVIVNMFQRWYRELGFIGCSSHSGRRTFITNAARKISLVGGSIRDVQAIAGHKHLQTTQRYIECDSESQRKVVDLV
ncbi:site-specific integrase [Ruficoccus amylovorans]|uniref:Site-specific integrase n=1 Tax=Ruficoccus amylovorans TaxID=1804625 RepID=A0A842HEL5_9BACT|nr:site-specific integrase [Ruficoccus amylovorans]